MKNNLIKLIIPTLYAICGASAYADAGVSVNTHSTIVCTTPTISAAAYASGNLVGGRLTFSNPVRAAGLTGLITQVMVVDLDAAGQPLELVIFNTNPSGTTFTDRAAFDPADGDMTYIAGSAYVSSFSAFSDNGIGQAQNLAIPIVPGNPLYIYGALVARGAFTPTAVTNIQICLGIVQD